MYLHKLREAQSRSVGVTQVPLHGAAVVDLAVRCRAAKRVTLFAYTLSRVTTWQSYGAADSRCCPLRPGSKEATRYRAFDLQSEFLREHLPSIKYCKETGRALIADTSTTPTAPQSIRVCQPDLPETEADPAQVDEDGNPIQRAGHGGCGHTQPDIRKEGLKLLLVNKKEVGDEDNGEKTLKTEDRKNLPASAALLMLKKIPEEDLHIMGLNTEEARPEWMILTVLPVPPMAVRPSVTVDGGAMRSEDDLTYSTSSP